MSPPRADYSTRRCRKCGACDWVANNNGSHTCRPCRNAHSRERRRELRLTSPAFVAAERATQAKYRASLQAQRQRIKAYLDGHQAELRS